MILHQFSYPYEKKKLGVKTHKKIIIIGFILTIIIAFYISSWDNKLYWDKVGVILPNGVDWNAKKVQDLFIMQDDNGLFLRNSTGWIYGYFSGAEGDVPLPHSIGLAFSNDEYGLIWEEYVNNPIITNSSEESYRVLGVSAPNVFCYNSSHYAMIHAGIDGDVFLTAMLEFSIDGISWIPYVNNPVMTTADHEYHWNSTHDPESMRAITVCVDPFSIERYGVGEKGYLLMFEARVNGTLGGSDIAWKNFAAVSQNLIDWTPLNDGEPVFKGSGIDDAWDKTGVANPKMFKLNDGEAIIMYNGITDDNGGGYSISTFRIGFAYTIDMNLDYSNWTRYVANPIIDIGVAVAWDDTHVKMDSVGKWGLTSFIVYYHGFEDEEICQTGAAILRQNWCLNFPKLLKMR